MSINNILNDIESAGPDFGEKITHRRGILKSFGSKVAALAVPLAVGAAMKNAKAQSAGEVYNVLGFLLQLELFSKEFYEKGLAANIIPVEYAAGFYKILEDEQKHVLFLADILYNAGLPIPTKPNYDFSGGAGSGAGPYGDPFNDYAKFLEEAQSLKDMIIRAYKGQLVFLMPNSTYLKDALDIHSVEAKHSAYIRVLRNKLGVEIKPWITGASAVTPGNGASGKIYANEDEITQLGIQLVNINGFKTTTDEATEAFDEPFEKAKILQLMEQFIVP